LKPALKTRQWEASIKTKAFQIRSAEELVDAYQQYAPVSPQMIAQEWIHGDDADLYTCNAYFDRQSHPLVTFVSRKLRQWPPDMGVASLAQECRNDEVRDLTVRLFQSAGFQGLAYLEVKRDWTSGKYVLIEANVGRPTGRSCMAEAAGVELLWTMYCDVFGLPLPAARQQSYGGVKWTYWRRDLQASFHRWKRGQLNVSDWWRSLQGRKCKAVFSWTDPMPCAFELWQAWGNRRTKRATADKPVPLLIRSSAGLP
jgi:predicted ATP-grasp superfamily ATP-dependent carboligase